MKKRGGNSAWMQPKRWISINDIHIVLIHANLNQLQKKYIVAVHQPPYTKMHFTKFIGMLLPLLTSMATPVASKPLSHDVETQNEHIEPPAVVIGDVQPPPPPSREDIEKMIKLLKRRDE